MKIRKGLFYTISTDIFLVLMAIFMFSVETEKERADSSYTRAEKLDEQNDNLRGKLNQVEIDLTKTAGLLKETKSSLGNTRSELSGAIRDGARKDGVIDELKKQVGILRGNNAQLSQENGELRSHLRSGDAVTTVVIIDTTPSMRLVLHELRQSLQTLFEFMPNTSKDFRVGILAFQNGVVNELPITQIHPVYVDRGRSQEIVLNFVGGLQTSGNRTNHLPVFKKAIDWIERAHPSPDPGRKERLIFLGDVGPSEMDGIPGYNDEEREMKNHILKGVRKWSSHGNRAIESLYAESDFIKTDPGAKESRAWFKALGQVSDRSAFYTESDALLRAVLHASLD